MSENQEINSNNHISLSNMPEKIKSITDVDTDNLSGNGVNINHFKIDREYRNKGYGTKALKGIIKYYKQNTNKEYIVINMGTRSIGTQKAVEWLEDIGFDIKESREDHVDGILELERTS